MEALERELSALGLAVSSIPGKGRGLLAAKDFARGDVILYQEPYASSPGKTSIGTSSCDGCFASANLRKCSRCRIAMYCGSACQMTFDAEDEPPRRSITKIFRCKKLCLERDWPVPLLLPLLSPPLLQLHSTHQIPSPLHAIRLLHIHYYPLLIHTHSICTILHHLTTPLTYNLCSLLRHHNKPHNQHRHSQLRSQRPHLLQDSLRRRASTLRLKVIQRTAIDNYNLVAGLVSHMSDLDGKQLVLYAQMANLVKLVLPSVEDDLREISENFSRLSCNAHTICDEELRPLGTGLYPIISIINHSCIPNSVLVFEGRIAFVRAVEPIHSGDEVVISYIETAATTKTRHNDLKQYFFSCSCPHCTKNPQEELKEDATLEGYRCKDQKCFGFLFHDTAKKTFTCQQCGLSRDEYNIESIANEVEEISTKAAGFFSAGNTSEASLLYRNVEQLETKLFHPRSIKLLRTRETLLKLLMELNDWRGALTYCQMTIPVYQRLYPSFHPILGLQYYTCGKLEWLLEQTADALKSFTKAVEILRVTHGSSTPFMKELFSRLDEARAEDSYKRSAKYYTMIPD